jgi:uncharacterized protein YdhG (YjbR/CyaY superfamily)
VSSSDVDAYLAAQPADKRDVLQRLREVIRATAPDAVEGLSYSMPTFKWKSRVLVYYAAFADHCSLFPASKAAVAAHIAELGSRATGRGTVRFTPDNPLPEDLVTRIIAFRISEIGAGRAG